MIIMYCKSSIEEQNVPFPNLPRMSNVGYVMSRELTDGGLWDQGYSISPQAPQPKYLLPDSALRMSSEFERLEDFFRQPFYVRDRTQEFARQSLQPQAFTIQIHNGQQFINHCRVINSEYETGLYFNPRHQYLSRQFDTYSPFFFEGPNPPLSKASNYVNGSVDAVNTYKQREGHFSSAKSFALNRTPSQVKKPPKDLFSHDKAWTRNPEALLFDKKELTYLQEILSSKPSTPYALLGVLGHSVSNSTDNPISPKTFEKTPAQTHESAMAQPDIEVDNPLGKNESKFLKIEPPTSYLALVSNQQKVHSKPAEPSGDIIGQKVPFGSLNAKLWPRLDDSDSLNDSLDRLNRTAHKKIDKVVTTQVRIQKRPRGRPRKYRLLSLLESSAQVLCPKKN